MKRLLVFGLALLVLLALAGTALAFTVGDGPSAELGPAATPSGTTTPSGSTTDDSSATSSPTGDTGDAAMPPVDPHLARYYDQKLDWSPCSGDPDNECATMQVPLNYADPTGDAIDLALLRVPATGDRQGSLVVNPGGPGAPGTQYAAAADRVFRPELTEHFDIVGFDPRGTGSSTTVDCLSDADLDAYLATDPDPETPAEVRAYQAQTRAMGEGCAKESGALAAHVTTIEAARDLDVLRGVLREPRLDYFGASYGTKLGATYAQLFPKNAGQMVLDGAVDVSLTPRALGLEQANGFETALRAYVADCVDGGDCFLGDSVEAGIKRIQRFLADVDAEPLPAGDRALTVGNAFYGIITPLYSRDSWTFLDTALKTAFAGDGTTLMLLADTYASRNPDGTYADNSTEANFDINCLDDPTSYQMSMVPGQVPAFEKASSTFGRVFAYSLTTCSAFKPRASERIPRITGAGAPPILVIGTTRDPATPMKWAVALSSQLESGVLVRRDGDGHTGYNAGNECVDTTVESFLVDGTVPDATVSC